MTLACYSARAGAAFLPIEGDRWVRMNADDPDTRWPCRTWEVAVALRGCTDVVELPADNVERLQTELFHAVELMNASDLTLWLLDATLPEDTRRLAARELEEFLVEPRLIEGWQGVFWWQPLGTRADLTGALCWALVESANSVVKHLLELRDLQSTIGHFQEALETELASRLVEQHEVRACRQRIRTQRQHVEVLRKLGRAPASIHAGDGGPRESIQEASKLLVMSAIRNRDLPDDYQVEVPGRVELVAPVVESVDIHPQRGSRENWLETLTDYARDHDDRTFARFVKEAERRMWTMFTVNEIGHTQSDRRELIKDLFLAIYQTIHSGTITEA